MLCATEGVDGGGGVVYVSSMYSNSRRLPINPAATECVVFNHRRHQGTGAGGVLYVFLRNYKVVLRCPRGN